MSYHKGSNEEMKEFDEGTDWIALHIQDQEKG
jgi:hypothetical protein